MRDDAHPRRAFGSHSADLDVDFSARPPFVATAIVARCTALDENAAWALPVGERTEALVALAALTSGGPLAVTVRCPRCREAIEFHLETEELRNLCDAGEREDPDPVRRPVGNDQREWLAARWPDAATARAAVLRTLLGVSASVRVEPDDAARIEQTLACIDPLVDFHLTVECGACGESAQQDVDLEGHALRVLRNAHERLLLTVARLAARFHWTESDVLALPAWRRERYLSLVEGAA